MKTRLPWIVLVALVIGTGDAAGEEWTGGTAGQSPSRAAASGGVSRVSVVEQPTGEPILVIQYPWTMHARPSVEVRLLADAEADNYELRPLCFVDDFMKGEVTVKVYHCQDRSADTPLNLTFSERDIDFEFLGERNSLGRPSVRVVYRTETGVPESGANAVYCLLRSWAVDKRMLYLDLPPAYFSKPGRIRVWFLRGKDIVWSETARWPGLGKQPAGGASAE